MSEATQLVLCSRSAHDQNVLARRAQWDQQGWPHSGRVSDKNREKKRVIGDQLGMLHASVPFTESSAQGIFLTR